MTDNGKREIMKRPGKALLLLLLFAVNASLLWQLKNEFDRCQRRNNRYVEKQLYATPLDNLAIFGADKYGADILIGTFPEHQNSPGAKEILIFSPFRKTYMGISFYLHLKVPRHHYYTQPVDVDNDGRVEIPLFWIENRRVHLELRDFAGKIISSRTLQPLSLPLPADTVSCSFIAISDIDRDGRMETVMAVSSEFFGLPRGHRRSRPGDGTAQMGVPARRHALPNRGRRHQRRRQAGDRLQRLGPA